MLLIHSTVEQLQNIQEKIVKLIYAPYLFYDYHFLCPTWYHLG